MTQEDVLLFGGTFDPIHNGHLSISRSAARELGVSKVVLIPSAQPPHKLRNPMSKAEDRLAMVQRAVTGDELFDVSDCELQRSGPSYTLDTVRYFHDLLEPEVELYWLIGADSVKELLSWYRIDQLMDECTFVIAPRPGFAPADLSILEQILRPDQIARLKKNILNTPLLAISATEIRRLAAQNKPIDNLVPPAVREYIIEKKLYRV